MKLLSVLVVILPFLLAVPAVPQVRQSGSISGRISDSDTRSPLPGATVVLLDTKFGTTADKEGNFILRNVPAGIYSLRVNYVGYNPVVKTDIAVGSGRTAQVDVELHESSLRSGEVIVTPGYFDERSDLPTSMTSFSTEEIRRAPGAGGDVSRILMSLPSLAKVNDQSNSLIVRGGSPSENEFLVDGIEVPNINHFPTQGATGGPIGILNVELINDVTFSAGGFPATFGDRLSSVMEIGLRDGNRTAFKMQANVDFAGVGAVAEGPIVPEKSSWILSVRRSYLDAIMKVINIGTTVAPSYGDAQLKVSFDPSPTQSLRFVDVFSDDHNSPDRTTAVENKMIYYGHQDIYMNTGGIVWRALWSRYTYSQTSLSFSYSKFAEGWFETNSGTGIVTNDSRERTLRLFSLTHTKLTEVHSLESGFEAKGLFNDYGNFYGEYTDALGDTTPAARMNLGLRTGQGGVFLNYILRPFAGMTLTAGMRADYFAYNSSSELSPRISASYALSDLTTLKFSSGVYYQNLPLLLLAQNASNKKLKTPRAVHYVAGVEHMLTEDTRMTVETYLKDYSSFPIDPSEPELFLLDELFYRYGFYLSHGALADNGKARSYGVELTVQKKLAKDFYGLVGASYFRSRYEDGGGVWRDRVFDNRILLSAEGGYRPDKEWEFSARWIFAGGVPYTPLNVQESMVLGRDVLDYSRMNGARLPDYHCLNVRVDKRFYFAKSNLVTYLSVWNVYNRRNVAQYFWNAEENKVDVIYQWGILPIFGVEYEF